MSKIYNFPSKLKTGEIATTKNLGKICGIVKNDRLNEVGILPDDELIIDTSQPIKNGNLVVVKVGDQYDCGFALLLGDGKLRLTYYNTRYEPETYALAEIEILGRVLSSSRNWQHFIYRQNLEVSNG